MDAQKAMQRFVTVGYHRTLPIADGVKLTFIDARPRAGLGAGHSGRHRSRHRQAAAPALQRRCRPPEQ